jgi:uncharacterized protein
MNDPYSELPPALPAFVPPPAPGPTKDERTWGAVAHFAQFAGFTGIPGAGVIGPLIVYFAKSDSPFVRRHAKQSIAFHIGLLIIGAVLTIFAFLTCGIGAFLAIPVGLVFAVMGVIYPVVAGMRANEGDEYTYPVTGGLVS